MLSQEPEVLSGWVAVLPPNRGDVEKEIPAGPASHGESVTG
ncbi:hypothetical protein HMPREF9154_0394 [Arachnia propionica F0230a]|nr:hypothetical protein HMPREF9154_0394 [Arachnia propionica F0230a]